MPCHAATYDNEATVRRMVAEQADMRVPAALVPRCPRCGAPMAMNLRCDSTFVEDAGWHAAAARYRAFLEAHRGERVVYLELGVGYNTPGIIKFPFQREVAESPRATYAVLNAECAPVPALIAGRSVCLEGDIGRALAELRAR